MINIQRTKFERKSIATFISEELPQDGAKEEKSSCLVEMNISVLRLIIGKNDPVVLIFTWLFLFSKY